MHRKIRKRRPRLLPVVHLVWIALLLLQSVLAGDTVHAAPGLPAPATEMPAQGDHGTIPPVAPTLAEGRRSRTTPGERTGRIDRGAAGAAAVTARE